MTTDAFNLDDALSKYVKKPSERAHPELALLYSRPGGGKTWLAASISEVPGVDKVLILDIEGSTVGAISDFDDDKIDIIPCERDTTVETFQFTNTILDNLFNSTTTHTYDAVIVDTFDVLQSYAADYFESVAATGKSGEKDGYEIWRNVKNWSISVARNLKRIPAYGILVVHDREEKAKDGGLETRLNLLGAAKDVLPGIPDMVAYLQRVLEDGDSEVTYGYFATQDDKVTKNRFHFPPVVKNPTFKGLFKYIDERGTGK